MNLSTPPASGRKSHTDLPPTPPPRSDSGGIASATATTTGKRRSLDTPPDSTRKNKSPHEVSEKDETEDDSQPNSQRSVNKPPLPARVLTPTQTPPTADAVRRIPSLPLHNASPTPSQPASSAPSAPNSSRLPPAAHSHAAALATALSTHPTPAPGKKIAANQLNLSDYSTLKAMCESLFWGIDLADRRRRLSSYHLAFLGKDAVQYFLENHHMTENAALNVCDALLANRFFHEAEAADEAKDLTSMGVDTKRKEKFKNKTSAFYQFTTLMHRDQPLFKQPFRPNSAGTTPTNTPLKNGKPWYDGLSGWLEKKRPQGGLTSWQKRYFALSLDDGALSYYKSTEESFPLSFIPLSEILLCQLLPDKKKGARFDILVSHRIYCMQADNATVASQWVAAISKAVEDMRQKQMMANEDHPVHQYQYQQSQSNLKRTATALSARGDKDKQENKEKLADSGSIGVLSVNPNANTSVSPNQRVRTPRTPDVLKAFWRQPPAAPSDEAHAALTPLKTQFFQLNFSVSSLNQPDFFQALLETFQSDDDILHCSYHLLLNPKSTAQLFTPTSRANAGNPTLSEAESKLAEIIHTLPAICPLHPTCITGLCGHANGHVRAWVDEQKRRKRVKTEEQRTGGTPAPPLSTGMSPAVSGELRDSKEKDPRDRKRNSLVGNASPRPPSQAASHPKGSPRPGSPKTPAPGAPESASSAPGSAPPPLTLTLPSEPRTPHRRTNSELSEDRKSFLASAGATRGRKHQRTASMMAESALQSLHSASQKAARLKSQLYKTGMSGGDESAPASSIAELQKYILYHAAANKKHGFDLLDIRKKMIIWMHSREFQALFFNPLAAYANYSANAAAPPLIDLESVRTGIPFLWALSQANSHDNAEDEQANEQPRLRRPRTHQRVDSYAMRNPFANAAQAAGAGKASPALSAVQAAAPSPALEDMRILVEPNSAPVGHSGSGSRHQRGASRRLEGLAAATAAAAAASAALAAGSTTQAATGAGGASGTSTSLSTGAISANNGSGNNSGGRGSPAASVALNAPLSAQQTSGSRPGSRRGSFTNLHNLKISMPVPAGGAAAAAAALIATIANASTTSATPPASSTAAHAHHHNYASGASTVPTGAFQFTARNHWRQQFDHSCAHCHEANNEFFNAITTRYSGARFSLVISNALLGVLVTPVNEVDAFEDIFSETFGVFNKNVVNSGVWRTLLRCLVKSPYHVRKHTLKDINGLLAATAAGSNNCESLLEHRAWQSWLFPLLSDIPFSILARDAANAVTQGSGVQVQHKASAALSQFLEGDPQVQSKLFEKIFQYTINAVSLIHFHAFQYRSPEEFRRTIRHSFQMALHYTNEESFAVPRALLSTLITRLCLKCKQRSFNLDGKWQSLEYIVKLTKAFVFSLPMKKGGEGEVDDWEKKEHNNNKDSHESKEDKNDSDDEHDEERPNRAGDDEDDDDDTTSHHHKSNADEIGRSGEHRGRPRRSSAGALAAFREGLHWREGLQGDRDVLEKLLDLFRTLRLFQEIDAYALPPSKQNEIKEFIEKNSTQHKKSKQVDLNDPEHGFHLTALSEHFAKEYQELSHDDKRALKNIQQEVSFVKDAAVFLAMMQSRGELLTETQIQALVSQFLNMQKREKVFASKLQL